MRFRARQNDVATIGADVVTYATQLYEGDHSDEVLRAITRGANEPPRVVAIEDPKAIPARATPAPLDAVITSPFDAEDLLAVLDDVLHKPYAAAT